MKHKFAGVFMKKNLKNIFDDMTTDIIPEGKESEYYTKEQSFELTKKIKQLSKFSLAFHPFLITFMILSFLKMFIDFPNWFSILIYVFVVFFLISIITGIVMYIKLLKFAKEISKEEVPIKSE
jgi:hypothetical protein